MSVNIDALSLEDTRKAYALEIGHTAPCFSPRLLNAFMNVPREDFLGPGPWTMMPSTRPELKWETPDDDPRHVYHNVLITLMAEKDLNNGLPSLYAYLLDQVDLSKVLSFTHFGCGTGYYSAIVARCLSPGARVVVYEIEPELSSRAEASLGTYANVSVVFGSALSDAIPKSDLILVSAGSPEVPGSWIDALTVGGNLVMPITDVSGKGAFVRITKNGRPVHEAKFLCRTSIYPCARPMSLKGIGAGILQRPPQPLSAARSLRPVADPLDDSCCAIGRDFWLSSRP